MVITELNIVDQKWEIHLLDEDLFIKQWGDSDAAVTIPKYKAIYFNEAELHRETVTHELCHAFIAEMCVSSASLSVGQFEEVMCDMFGKYGNKILTLSRKLYKELKSAETS